MAAACDGHQRCFALRVLRVGIGARLEQRVDDRRRADDGGFGQRRRAELVLERDVRAGLDQRAHQLEIVIRRGPHDGRCPIGSWRVWTGALRQQAQCRRAIAALGRIDQCGLGRLRQGFGAQGGCRDRGGGEERDDCEYAHLRAPRRCRRCRRVSRPGCCCGRTASRGGRQSASPADTSSADRP